MTRSERNKALVQRYQDACKQRDQMLKSTSKPTIESGASEQRRKALDQERVNAANNLYAMNLQIEYMQSLIQKRKIARKITNASNPQ